MPIYSGRFSNRTAIVTGGASGLGLEAAKRIVAEGGKVCLWDLNPDALADGKKESGAAGTIALDVSDAKAVEAAAAQSQKTLGKIDILINSAGITGATHTVVGYPIDSWLKVMDVNVNGLFYCCRFVVPLMLDNGYGRIVNISSVAGKEGNPNASSYSASKAAVLGFTKSLGKELATKGVIVNAVTPATFESPILKNVPQSHIDYMRSKIPMERFGTASEIASAVCWLASEECSFTTANTLDTSGGADNILKMLRAVCLGGVAALLLLTPHIAGAAQPKAATPQSAFQQEQAMSPAQLIKRWTPITTKASQRFGVPLLWINAVMRLESGGRTMLTENQRMISEKGALGLMQVLPGTFAEMREQYRLGADPFDPRANINAGSAYLAWLHKKYGYPALFAAYNAGPGQVDDVLTHTRPLPAETRAYLAGIDRILGGNSGADGASINAAKLTRPDGTTVLIDPIAVTSIRAVSEGEYTAGVQSVVTAGKLKQGVREDVATITAAVRIRGGGI